MRVLLCLLLGFCFVAEGSRIREKKERRRDRIEAAKKRARKPYPPSSPISPPGFLTIHGGTDSLAQKLHQIFDDEVQHFRVATIEQAGSALSLRGTRGEEIECEEMAGKYRCVFEQAASIAAGSVPAGQSFRVRLAAGLLHDSAVGRLFKLLHLSRFATCESHDSASDHVICSLFDGQDKSISANTLTCEVSPDTGVASRQVNCTYLGVAN